MRQNNAEQIDQNPINQTNNSYQENTGVNTAINRNEFDDGRDIRDPKIDQAGDPEIKSPEAINDGSIEYGTGNDALDVELGIPHTIEAEEKQIRDQRNDKYIAEGKRGPGIEDQQDRYVISGENIEEVPISGNTIIDSKDREQIPINKSRDAREIREMIEENPRILYPTI